MIYGYIRVSTDRQTVENQRHEIKSFCRKEGLQVDIWIAETTSGANEVNKRKLGQLLEGVQQGDIIICSEISRLGRSLFMIMEILNHCMTIGVKVWTIKDNYRLGDFAKRKRNHRNTMSIFVIVRSANNERNSNNNPHSQLNSYGD